MVQTDMATGHLVRANQAFCEMVGYSEAELQLMTNADLTHPDDWGHDAKTFERLRLGELDQTRALTRCLRKDGTVVWLELYITILREGGGITNIAVVNDVTERKAAEESLRQVAERDAFHVALNDALRPLYDPVAIQAEACRLLGEHLSVDRTYYVEVNKAESYARVHQDYLRGDSPSLAGSFRLADYGWIVPFLLRGETVIVADTEHSENVPDADREAMAAVRIAAHVSIPLVKAGVLVGALCVTEAAPREWLETEIELVRETGERIWAAVEQARAEAAVRDLNHILEQRVVERTEQLLSPRQVH